MNVLTIPHHADKTTTTIPPRTFLSKEDLREAIKSRLDSVSVVRVETYILDPELTASKETSIKWG